MNVPGNQRTLETLKDWFTEGVTSSGITLHFDRMSTHLASSVYSAFNPSPTVELETSNKAPDIAKKEPDDGFIAGSDVRRVQ